MKICLDARQLRQAKTGLGRYAVNLVRQIAAVDSENEYVILRRDPGETPLTQAANFTEVAAPYGISSPRNQLFGARVVNPIKADIYHALYHFLPIGVRARKVVVTLHDLFWIENASLTTDVRWLGWLKRLRGGMAIGHALRRAEHIISISASSRDTACRRLGLPENKFTVIHHGVDPVFYDPLTAPLPEACQDKRFIFSLGAAKPYKNLARLIQAFAAILPSYPDLFLVLTGRGDSYPALMRLVSQLRLESNVVFTSQLSDAEIRTCFARAQLFAFPSILEGFGLPLIEAMAGGCPVLTSDRSAMAEVVGDAAVCVDPLDVDAIAAGLRRLLDDEAFRHQLIAQGRHRSEQFTWQDCAAQTLTVYDRLMT